MKPQPCQVSPVNVYGDISSRRFYFRFRDNVDDSFNIVPVKLFQYEDVEWWEDVRYRRSRPMIVLLADFSPDDGRVQRRCVRVYSQAQQ